MKLRKGPSNAGRVPTSSKGLSSTAPAASPYFAPKMPLSRRRCCRRKQVSSQVICRSSASTLALRSARTRSCRSTTSSSRWNPVAGGSMESVSDWDNAAAEDGNWDTGVDVLPLRACSSLLMAFRERRHRFKTGSSLRRRTGQPDTSRGVVRRTAS